MTTMASFYVSAAAAPPEYRRYSLGAAYSLGERVNWGFSVAAARATILSIPAYANALSAAGLTSAFNAIDSVSASSQVTMSQATSVFSGTNSPWNTALPGNVAIDAASSTQLTSLNAVRTAPGRGAWMEAGNYSSNVYVVSANAPRVPMYLMTTGDVTAYETATQNGGVRPHLAWQLQQGVPLTDGMRAALGTDAHMVVIDAGTGEMWDLFTVWRDGGMVPWSTNWNNPTLRNAQWGTGTWKAWGGGYIADHRQNIGQFQDLTVPKQYASWGSTATSLPIAAGMILENELRSGTIPHALQMLIPNPLVGFNWPAQRDDGYAANDATWVAAGLAPTVKEGTRLRLKSTVSDTVTTGYGATFDDAMRMVRVALKTYGAVINDRSGDSIVFRAEPTRYVYERFNPGGWDPWPQPWSNALLAAGLPAFTTANWEVIDPTYRPGQAPATTDPLGSLTDNFNDNVLDTAAIWTVAGDVTETGGQLQIATRADAVYSSVKTPGRKFTGSFASIQIVSAPTGNSADQCGIGVLHNTDASVNFGFMKDGANLKAQYKNTSLTTVTLATVAFNATNHAHLRIRLDNPATTVTYETSVDGTSWTAFASVALATSGQSAATFDAGAQASIFSGNWNSIAGRPAFIVDNFNL